MAHTSRIPNAGSDEVRRIRLLAKGSVKTINLPDLPKDVNQSGKGDFWKLSIRSSFGFTKCITLNDIHGITILQGSNDGWKNIKSIVTFAVVDQNNWELISADFNVNVDTDGDDPESHKEFDLSVRSCLSEFQCIRYLYVMAHTSGVSNGGSDSGHQIELRITGDTKVISLRNHPGDDYDKSKVYMWGFNIKEDFGLSCVKIDDIKGIAILSGSNDGWNIDSIVTYIAVNAYHTELSSVDFVANRWIDDDSSDDRKRFELNLVL